MTFEELSKCVGKIIGMEDLSPQLEEDGAYRFYVEMPEDLVLTYTDIPEHNLTLLTCDLGPMPQDDTEELMQDMLAFNNSAETAFTGTLSIDPESNHVFFTDFEDLSPVIPALVGEFFERVVNFTVKWHDRLGGFNGEEVVEDGSQEPGTDEAAAEEEVSFDPDSTIIIG